MEAGDSDSSTTTNDSRRLNKQGSLITGRSGFSERSDACEYRSVNPHSLGAVAVVNANVAQLIEHLICTQAVAGLTPVIGSMLVSHSWSIALAL